MKKYVLVPLVVCSLLLGVTGRAAADSFTVTFGTDGGTAGFNGGGEYSYLSGDLDSLGAAGLTLTVLPWSSVDLLSYFTVISSTSLGYGVDCNIWIFPCDDKSAVDGNHQDDGLQFNFSSEVTLTQVTFLEWGNWDDAQVRTGSIFYPESSTIIPGAFSDDSGVYDPVGGLTASGFFFGAFGTNDAWRIRSLTFEYGAPQVGGTDGSVSAVPEPATLALAGVGLAMVARQLRRRRRRLVA